ncbi:MAG TPA: hypothetical protein VIL42_10310 [Sphingomicrobium sp.]
MNPARRFAKRALQLPGLPLIAACSAAAVVIATLSGAFGTESIALPRRLLFWTLLIGLNTSLWVCWFTWRVKSSSDWWRAALLGALVINFPIPAEIFLFLRLAGGETASDWHLTWLHAGAVSLAILMAVVTGARMLRRPDPVPQVKGKLWRAGVRDLAAVTAITAEDHYCRVSLADGSSRLLLGRFADVIAEAGDVEGAIVRRGHWVAASAVHAIERRGRGWAVVLRTGGEVRIAGSSVQPLKGRGWLSNSGAAAAN